jgi:Caspase domain
VIFNFYRVALNCCSLLCVKTNIKFRQYHENPRMLKQPCRGTNPELQLMDNGNLPRDNSVALSAGWLTSKPNRDDFIIFYATVESIQNFPVKKFAFSNLPVASKETSANRSENLGTWFIQSICIILDEMQADVDILTFLTRVQNHVCQRTRSDLMNTNIGQTPQLQFLASKYIQICARHSMSR